MAIILSVELNDLEEKVAKNFCLDPQEYFSNWVKTRINIEKQNIYDQEVKRLKETGADSIPLNVDNVISAMELKTVVQLNAEAAAKMPKPGEPTPAISPVFPGATPLTPPPAI